MFNMIYFYYFIEILFDLVKGNVGSVCLYKIYLVCFLILMINCFLDFLFLFYFIISCFVCLK